MKKEMITMESRIKSKINLMVVTLGLIVAMNYIVPVPEWFVFLFDTLGFVILIVLLYGVRKDSGKRTTPAERIKIIKVLMVTVAMITVLYTQLIPKPYSYSLGGAGLVLIGLLSVAWKEEKTKV